jgi:MFS family permease
VNDSVQQRSAFRFVFIMSIVSLFGDMTYEGARSIVGPFMAQLGASGLAVGFIAGIGELAGYVLRLGSGFAADRTRRYWETTFVGYIFNLFSTPALALVRTWPVAAAFIIGERAGRGIRKPPRDAMLASAGTRLGQGWVFGFNELMDQTGATLGPLIVALVLFLGGSFHHAFALLAIPAVLSLVVLVVAQRQFPHPSHLEIHHEVDVRHASRVFWVYAVGAALLGAGFADFALVSYHLELMHVVSSDLIPVLYAGAMLAAAIASPLLGKAFDAYGGGVVVAAFAVAAFATPLVFLGGFTAAVAGVLLWGVGMSAQDALFPAIVSRLVPAQRRATALGTFGAVYGVAWFAGSTLMGELYDSSILLLVAVSLVLQIGAVVFLAIATGRVTGRV